MSPVADSAIPVTRPRGRVTLVGPLVVAAVAGLAAGLDPGTTLVGAAAVVSGAVLVVRVDWAALALVGAAVWEHYLAVVNPWAIEWLSVVLLLAWAVRRASGPLHDRRSGLLLVPAVALGVVVLLSAVAHLHGRVGVEAGSRYVLLVLVLLVLADCLAGPVSPRQAARVYVASCVVAAACGIVTALVGPAHVVAGPLARPVDLAFFLVVAVPLVGNLAGASRRTARSAWPAWVSAAVLVVAILGTQSRGSWVALVVVLLLAAAARLRSLRGAGVLLVLTATGAAFVVTAQPAWFGDLVADGQRRGDTRIVDRDDLWRAAISMVRESPALGLGPGSYALLHQDHLDPGYLDGGTGTRVLVGPEAQPGVARSTPFEVAAELGFLGAAALSAALVVPVVQSVRRRRRGDSALAIGVALAMVGALVASLSESEQHRLPLWFVAALAIALGRAERRTVIPFGGRRSSGQEGRR